MATNDYTPQHSYQDDFGGGPDPIMNELDDPTIELGIPANEFAKELDRLEAEDSEDPGQVSEGLEDNSRGML